MDYISQFISAMKAAGYEPFNISDIVDTNGRSILIKEASDKGASKSLYFSLSLSGRANGHWYSCRTSDGDYWVAGGNAKALTAEEKAEMAKARAEAEKIKEAQKLQVAKQCHDKFKGLKLAESHGYLTRKGIKPNKARIDGDALVIPAVDIDWKLWTLQSIYEDGAKYFVNGGSKKGNFYPIGLKKDDNPEFIFICEGYATACTIFEAMSEPAVCAFDKGNLAPVAQAMRKKWKDAKIILCADDGEFEVAEKAAALVGGFTVAPDSGIKGHDFNDAGVEFTRNKLATFIMPDISDDKPPSDDHVQPSEVTGGDFFTEEESSEMSGDWEMPFRVLGYNGDQKIYYSFREKQIISLGANQHNMSNLLRLATYREWQDFLSGGGQDLSQAQLVMRANDKLFTLSVQRGIFDYKARVRGCGMWLDGDDKILHCGDYLYVNGAKKELYQYKRSNIYVARPKLFTPNQYALSNTEAIKLRDICEQPTWDNPLSGSLLAGWLVIAPIGSMLEWRPHIWVAGQSGSGKSTVIEKIIKGMLGDIAIYVEGNTTEPYLRQAMGYDARPIIFDEAEPCPSFEPVLRLARISSSGGVVGKYGQDETFARYCFAFSSIDTAIKEIPDENRISIFVLRKNVAANRIVHFEELKTKIHNLITKEYAQRMLARTVNNLDSLLANIQTFFNVGNSILRDSRSAAQIAPMLAGLYMLSSTSKISKEKATEWVKSKEWESHTTIAADPDHVRLVSYIMNYQIRPSVNGDISFGELISEVYENPNHDFYDKTLKIYGIKVQDGRVYISNTNSNLKKILAKTNWVDSYPRTLSDFTEHRKEHSQRFGVGQPTRAISLPIEVFLG